MCAYAGILIARTQNLQSRYDPSNNWSIFPPRRDYCPLEENLNIQLVGTRGFEPPASPTPKVRATPAPRPDNYTVHPLYYGKIAMLRGIPISESSRLLLTFSQELGRQIL
jgi:hypothetical protein